MADIWVKEISPDHKVVVDHHGLLYVETKSYSPVTNVDEFKDALDAGRVVVAAVFPPADRERTDLKHTWETRLQAFRALGEAGQLAPSFPGHEARIVTGFLHDWDSLVDAVVAGRSKPRSMEEFAHEWERWW